MYRYVVICIMLTCYRWFIRNPCGCALNQMHKRLDLGHVISMTPIRWSLGSSDCPAQKWLFCPKIEVWSSTRPIHTRLFIPQRSWSYLRLYHLSTIFTYPKKNIKKKTVIPTAGFQSPVTYSFQQPSQPSLSGVELHGSPFGLQRTAPGDCQQNPAGAAGVSQRMGCIWNMEIW